MNFITWIHACDTPAILDARLATAAPVRLGEETSICPTCGQEMAPLYTLDAHQDLGAFWKEFYRVSRVPDPLSFAMSAVDLMRCAGQRAAERAYDA